MLSAKYFSNSVDGIASKIGCRLYIVHVLHTAIGAPQLSTVDLIFDVMLWFWKAWVTPALLSRCCISSWMSAFLEAWPTNVCFIFLVDVYASRHTMVVQVVFMTCLGSHYVLTASPIVVCFGEHIGDSPKLLLPGVRSSQFAICSGEPKKGGRGRAYRRTIIKA